MKSAHEIEGEIRKMQEGCVTAGTSLLPALYIAQRRLGWLSEEALTLVAETLRIPKAKVRGVASFYAMFRHMPVGRHVIQLCTNVSCMVLGAERLVDLLRAHYKVEPKGTSPDGRFTLVIMECIGACGTAPAMLVNTDFHENLTEDSLREILDRYR
jgi:NADH-quinone oxidoreductase E subunit